MSNALVPFNDLQQMGIALAKSGLFGMKSPEQAIALMLVAQAEGQHPATIAQDYDIIQGKATRKTHSVLARFQAAGGKVEWHALTGMIADATFSHPQGGSLRMEWTIAQAKLAGLTGKDNWKNYPRAMLRARCIAEGVRAVYPGAIGGMLVAEEAQDMPQAAPQRQTAHVPASDGPSAELLTQAEAAADGGVATYQAFWEATGSANRKLLAGNHGQLKADAVAADAARTVEEEPDPRARLAAATADGAPQ
jgi:hypothetical protein